MACKRDTLILEPSPPLVGVLERLFRGETVIQARSDAPDGVVNIAGASNGLATALANISALAAIEGLSPGQATALATLVAGSIQDIEGLAAGGSAGQGLLSALAALSGTAAGSSSALANLSASNVQDILGTSVGTSTAAAVLNALATLSGTAAGAGALSGDLNAFAGLLGLASGGGAAQGLASAFGRAAGNILGTGTLTGTIDDALSGGVSDPSTIAGYLGGWTTDFDPATPDGAVLSSWNNDNGGTPDLNTDIFFVTRDNASLDGNDCPALATNGYIRESLSSAASLFGLLEFEIFIVCDMVDTNGPGFYFLDSYLFGEDSENACVGVDGSGNPVMGLNAGGDFQARDTGINLQTSGVTVVRAGRDNGNLFLQVDDRTIVTASGLGTTLSGASGNLLVGSQRNSTEGLIHVVATYDRFLPAGDRTDVYSYIAATYPSAVVP